MITALKWTSWTVLHGAVKFSTHSRQGICLTQEKKLPDSSIPSTSVTQVHTEDKEELGRGRRLRRAKACPCCLTTKKTTLLTILALLSVITASQPTTGTAAVWLDPVVAPEGDTISMNCLPDTDLQNYISYTWLKGPMGSLLPGGLDSLHQKMITLENVQSADTCNYICIVQPTQNHTISYNCIIQTVPRPLIMEAQPVLQPQTPHRFSPDKPSKGRPLPRGCQLCLKKTCSRRALE